MFFKVTIMTIEKTKLAESVEEQFNKAVAASGEVCDALLMQDGWNILNELGKATHASVLSTSLVMIPAMQNKELILTKVSDPIAFNKNLETASDEIASLVKSLQVLQGGHYNKEGSPSIEDMDLISELTLGYSKIQTAMETSVHPLILAMVDHMQEAGVDTEEVFLKDTQNAE